MSYVWHSVKEYFLNGKQEIKNVRFAEKETKFLELFGYNPTISFVNNAEFTSIEFSLQRDEDFVVYRLMNPKLFGTLLENGELILYTEI